MIRRVRPIPAVCLMLVIATIFGVGHCSAQSQPTRPLVFSTYLGGAEPCVTDGNPLTFAQNAACDPQGNTYVTGATQVSDLPVLNAYQAKPASGSTMSAFVAKYDPAGKPLWCTYLGGNNQSMGVGVAAMPAGGVVVAGLTTSADPVPFPTTTNAYQGQNHGQSDYFVTVFDANGNLLYSTYLGGSGVEGPLPPATFADDSNNGNPVAVDAAGLVYVAGITNSGGSGAHKFPVTSNALQSELCGSLDACLCILDPSQNGLASLVYGSFLGGTRDDQGHSVAVNASGNYIAVAGYTNSVDFPTTPNAYRNSAPPAGFVSNGFVAQVESTQPGSPSSVYSMRYCTYLGADTSDARDDTYGMTLDPTGLIVATGRTQSAGFPMTSGGPGIFNSLQTGTTGDNPYLVKIDPASTGTASLVYSTFLGGGGSSSEPSGAFGTSVGVDARGTAYVAGETDASGGQYVPSGQPVAAPQTFPYTPNALLTALQGSFDAIFMQINPGGATLGYSTYLGGVNSDRTYGLAVDPAANVVLSGLTFSADFPLKNPAQVWPGKPGVQNAFVTKFSVGGRGTGSLLLLLLAD